MAVSDQNLTNEIQLHLLEPPNNGASYQSLLYTTAEVAARLNYRANLFNLLTNSFVNFTELPATNNSKIQNLVNNFMDIIDVNYSATGTLAGGGLYYSIPAGSSLEGDEFITVQTAVTLPSLYTIDSSQVLTINFFPAPTFTDSNGQMMVFYTPTIGVFPAVPNGTTFQSGFPDDLTPFIKYGVLADLFNKSGETHDPLRGSICEGLFNLGIELARSWISGSVFEPVAVQQPFIAPING